MVAVEYVGASEEEMAAWELWAGNGAAFGGAAKGEWHVAVQHKGHDSTEVTTQYSDQIVHRSTS